ncbi:hypothetical protein ASJ79_20460 [Mycobacterium sp. NAZ190054]|nr:hypothetical protein ASJ79_20460 [Mycobacterium sp. NAZ190054]
MKVRRTYMEVPPMDERKWAKIPDMPADVFLADMEDSVPPDLKREAREKVVGLIEDPSFFGGREFICRPNNINTEWGREDLEAIAAAKAPFVMYPKPRTAAEVREVKRIFDRHGATPEIMLLVETPETVLRLEEIAQVPGVCGLMVGPGDLALETGMSLFDGNEVFTDGFLYARSKTIMVARALKLEAAEGLLVANLKDSDLVRRVATRSALMGFTGNMMFYPPQIELINECHTPSLERVQWARKAVEAYDQAVAAGQGAVTVDGRAVTVHQYGEAKEVIRFADAIEGMATVGVGS